MDQELFNPQSSSVSSSRIIYTPSTFARISLLHLQAVCVPPGGIAPFTSLLTDLYNLAASSDYIRDMRINEKLGTLLTLLMHPESVTVSRKRMELAAVKSIWTSIIRRSLHWMIWQRSSLSISSICPKSSRKLMEQGQQLSDLKADHQSQVAASLHRYDWVIPGADLIKFF